MTKTLETHNGKLKNEKHEEKMKDFNLLKQRIEKDFFLVLFHLRLL